jgi:hypothetical protein
MGEGSNKPSVEAMESAQREILLVCPSVWADKPSHDVAQDGLVCLAQMITGISRLMHYVCIADSI